MADSIDATMEAPDSNDPPMNTQEAENSPPKRLIITKMKLENFKSYAGVREIGPFHKQFSAVVGPNGSGKSNVIDAMLFVFGKRAKKLRLNKVSELIHKSDAVAHDPPTQAAVSVFFQEIVDTGTGDEDYEIVPDTMTEVTRVARKDNSSTYKLNGKTCQFKVIAAYLHSKGIDLDNNRFLILQGEVEMISMMPPKGKNENDEGLLEYLEDIIGSSKYVEETNSVGLKVEALTDARQEKLNRVKAVEKEKDCLENAKMEAESLLGKEREIRRKQNILYQIHGAHAEREVTHYGDKKSKAEGVLQQERERLEKADVRVQEIESGLADQQAEYETVHAELKQTKEEFTAYERRDIKLREDVKHEKAQKKKLDTKLKAETKKEQDAVAKEETAVESIPQLEGKIEELVESKAEEDAKLEEIYEEMKGVTQTLRTELETKTQELAPVHQERAVFQADLDTAKTEVKLLEDSTRRAQERLTAAEEELATLDEKQESKRTELAAGEDELAQAKERIVEAQTEEEVLAEKEAKVSKKNKQLLARSEDAKAALQAKGGVRNSAVAGILKAARKGGPLANVGILGRLGDLASVPEEYDVAVSTACSSLDNIVVQTTAGAQRCLEFLRKHGLGRANFTPLDKMKKGAHDHQVETPEGAPRLFEVITPSNYQVTPALFLGVGNTLVAPDLETATRWAYDFGKRWRVVTIDGKLIETAGTMSGGGKGAKRGGMRLANGRSTGKVTAEEEEEMGDCKQLEAQAAEAQAFLQECRKRRKELADEIRTLKKRIKVLEVKVPKLSMEIAGCDTTREELTKRIPELKAKSELSEDDASKLVGLSKKVSKCKTDMSSCSLLASKLETEVARLQKAILDAGGTKLKKQQAACEKTLSTLNATEKALNAAKVAIASSQKAATKARKVIEATETQLEECKASSSSKKEELKQLEVDALRVHESYEKVMEIESEKREALEAVTKECEALKKAQADVKCVEIELLGHIEAFDKQITDCERKVDHWTSEISKLRAVAEEDDDFDLSDDEEEDDEVEATAPEQASDDGDGDVEMEEAQDGVEKSAPKEVAPKGPKSSLPKLSLAALEKYDKEVIKGDITMLETERNTIAKNANMGAIAEYRKKEADYLSRVSDLDTVTEERNEVRKTFEELRRKRLEMFMDGFGQITLKLKEMYQMITLGGDAELELVDSLDPFAEGIVFSVRPPKKSWKNISNLSGGEKTLSSLALVFALHHFKPTPLYVMDEIDAALDFKNVSIVANYIKERTKNAQFIIISLRNNMFELADRLVGIYKTNNCTKSITIDPRAFGVSGQQNGLVPPTPALAEKTNSQKPVDSSAKDDAARRRVSFQSEATDSLEAH